VYIADQQNQRIRMVAAGSGTITTVAGNGTAGFDGDGGPAAAANFNNPTRVAVDGDGNLYIADYYNWRIRKVAAGSGIITTIAGTGDVSGFSGDGGPAIAAQLSYPSGVAVDGIGRVYIADSGNNRIRQLVTSSIAGTTTTLSSSSNPSISGQSVTF